MKITTRDKINCWITIIFYTLKMAWGKITALFIYPIWYIFRKEITALAYKGTSWQEIKHFVYTNNPHLAKQKLLANGYFIYWLWTYGELTDPAGEGEMPLAYGKRTFWNRFRWNALRNPRFNVNYLDFRTGKIVYTEIVKDTRNFDWMHKSFGISDSPDGIYYAWMKDDKGKAYFIYEDNSPRIIFYFGYVGFINNEGGRFEMSRRKTDSSYTAWLKGK